MKTNRKIVSVAALIVFFAFSNLSAQTTSVYVSAHPDDWQLFMNPNAYNSMKGTDEKVIFIHTTAGDAGNGILNNYYLAREEGSLRAIRFMSNAFLAEGGLGTNMNQTTANVNGHQVLKFTYRNAVIYFLRLPDGDYGGTGYLNTYNESLQKLYNGSITTISAIDGSTTYSTVEDLQNTLKSIIETESIGNIQFNLADHDASINPYDHSDHIYSSLLMQNVATTLGGVTLNLYSEYNTADLPVNVFNDDLMINAGTWGATASGLSDKEFYSSWDNNHNVWLYRQYFRTVPADIPPIATVVATDPEAMKNPLDTGTFTVSLNSENTGSPITINYTVEDTATPGIDYIELPGTITIPNGQQSETITVTPLNNPDVEPMKTVILTLESTVDYTVGNPSTATVYIAEDDTAPHENIALNKPTASSDGAERSSSNANDGVYSLDNWWGASPYPQWWSVDLGDEYNLSQLVVINYYDGYRYYQYDIEGSLDGMNWTPLADFNENTTTATSEGNTFHLNNSPARYIRVNLNYNSENIGVHIVEFEAYGTLAQTSGRNTTNPTRVSEKIKYEMAKEYFMSVYPNPVKSGYPIHLRLELPSDQRATVGIFDVHGRMVATKNFNLKKGFNEVEMATHYFSTGMLIVKVVIQGEVMTKKIFIE